MVKEIPAEWRGFCYISNFTWIELVYLQSDAQALARPTISSEISVFTVDRFRIEYLSIIYMTIVIGDCIDVNIAAGSFFTVCIRLILLCITEVYT